MRIVSALSVREAISMDDAIEALARYFRGDREPNTPLRQQLSLGDVQLLVMAAARERGPGSSNAGVKVVSVCPGNQRAGWPTVQASYLLFGGVAMAPLAMIEGGALTALRTAAVSGLATRALARVDASRLVVFGAGIQAQAHLRAMLAVRSIERVVIVNRDAARASAILALAEELNIHAELGNATAVSEADIVCTCTTSNTPVFDGGLLSQGAHVNAIGAFRPDSRELDDVAIARGRVFVEEREAALSEAGDLIIPIQAGNLEAAALAGDIFEICSGTATRGTRTEITIFKSVGLAIEDLVLAEALLAALPEEPVADR